ncbi:longitudinals lacking protein, isoforms A/B/D/L-like [Sitodiplosis mosellana]|uniref:longitudinals lacking protein, isoforms A/B/D/L-like n=1 Tax=Sitodiplosis mosellana TaxID=263140 RepID=UPI002443FF1C|nr:longitudinals lacking protein, isoforms A/B/D/L-like [Sitodiplosis mosellana]
MPLVTQLREGIHPLLFPTDLTVNPIASVLDDKKSIKLLSPSTHDRNSSANTSSGSGNEQAGGGYMCPAPDCGRVYKLKSSLRNHQKWECGKDPQFQCPFCVYRAKQKMHIGRHMERMHKNNAAMLKAAAAAVVAATAAAATGIKREEENSSDSYTASDKE